MAKESKLSTHFTEKHKQRATELLKVHLGERPVPEGRNEISELAEKIVAEIGLSKETFREAITVEKAKKLIRTLQLGRTRNSKSKGGRPRDTTTPTKVNDKKKEQRVGTDPEAIERAKAYDLLQAQKHTEEKAAEQVKIDLSQSLIDEINQIVGLRGIGFQIVNSKHERCQEIYTESSSLQSSLTVLTILKEEALKQASLLQDGRQSLKAHALLIQNKWKEAPPPADYAFTFHQQTLAERPDSSTIKPRSSSIEKISRP